MKNKFLELFPVKKPVIGMIHLASHGKIPATEQAQAELDIYEACGVDAAIVENFFGLEEDVASVLRNCMKYQRKIVLGVNVLPNEFNLSIPWASEYGARFVQLDYVAGRYIGNKELDLDSYLDVCERYPDITVLGGVWPKYYTPIGSDLRKDLFDGAARADAVVVTGTGTGQETPVRKIKAFRKILDEYAKGYPLVVGAGVTADNAREQLGLSDGAIIGSYFKKGDVRSEVAKENIERIMSIAAQARKQNYSAF